MQYSDYYTFTSTDKSVIRHCYYVKHLKTMFSEQKGGPPPSVVLCVRRPNNRVFDVKGIYEFLRKKQSNQSMPQTHSKISIVALVLSINLQLTFHVFWLIERIHCLRLVEPPASTSPSSTGAATWNQHVFTLQHCLCRPTFKIVQVLHLLTYTRQFVIVQIHPRQTVLKGK